MPVNFDQHKPGGGRVDLSEGTNARALIEFLLQHPNIGFTQGELAEETGIPKGSVGPTLKRLKKAGMVRHKEPYWAAAEDDRIAAAAAAVLGINAADASFSDDWYAQNDGWEEEYPDLSGEGA